jgi:hypothetical protein
MPSQLLRLKENVSRVVIGKREVLDLMLVGLITRGAHPDRGLSGGGKDPDGPGHRGVVPFGVPAAAVHGTCISLSKKRAYSKV